MQNTAANMDLRTPGRDELKLFAVFVLVFTLFIHWGGVNAWSRYDLTKSMVENQSLEISEYAYNTMDKKTRVSEFYEYKNSSEWKNANLSNIDTKRRFLKALFNDPSTEVYTGKGPISSFLAVPGYVVADSLTEVVGGGNESIWVESGIRSAPVSTGFETAFKQLLIVFSVSVLFGAILLVLIHQYLQEYVEGKTALYTVLILGLGTPLAYYTTSFLGVINAALFGFAGYLALKKSLEDKNSKWAYVSGALCALAISTEYYAGLIAAGLGLYLLSLFEWKKIAEFAGGTLIGAIPMFLYHWAITGNPLIPVAMSPNFTGPGPVNVTCSFYAACKGGSVLPGGFVIEPIRALNVFMRLLFFESRGIFFYAPILLLIIPGIYEIYKKNKRMLIIFPGIFFLLLAFQTIIINWLAGISFGPRYALVGLPFLALPLALGLEKILKRGRVWQIFLLAVFLLSAFQTSIGFNAIDTIEPGFEKYNERMNNFSPVQPRIYDNLLENFNRYGARSELLMSLTDRHKGLDFSYRGPYGPEFLQIFSTSNYGVLFSTNLVPIIIALTVLLGVLWSQIGDLRIPGIILLAILILASISISESHIIGDKYRVENGVVKAGGELKAYFYLDEGEVPYLEARILDSKQENSVLNTTINGKKVSREFDRNKSLYFPFRTTQGKNVVKLQTGKCWVPALTSNSSDRRCISLKVNNLSIVDEEGIKRPILVRGSYNNGELPKEGSWIGEEGSIAVYSPNSQRKMLKLELRENSALKNYSANLTFNGDTIGEFKPPIKREVYIGVNPVKGWNNVTLDIDKCLAPSEISNSTDKRCLGMRIQNVSLLNNSQLAKGAFVEGWYAEEKVGRWMRRKGKIITNFGRGNILKLDVTPYKQLKQNKIKVRAGNITKSFNVEQRRQLLMYVGKNAGIDNVSILSTGGCKVPSKVGKSNDDRCLSILLNEFSIRDKYFGKGWYTPESTKDNKFRWMPKKAKIKFSTKDESSAVRIKGQFYSEIEDKTLYISINGRNKTKVKPYNGNKVSETFNVETEEGLNTLNIYSSACKVPAQVERNSDDARCLSFRLDSITFGNSGENFILEN